MDALEQGRHVIVSTSTASGKSVIYQACRPSRSPYTKDIDLLQVPFLRDLAQDPQSTAIFIYPTKASVIKDYTRSTRNEVAPRLLRRTRNKHWSNYYGRVLVWNISK